MSTDKIMGPEKAAILLLTLGEEAASRIVKQLTEEEIKRLGSSMTRIFSVSAETAESVFLEFNEMSSSNLPIQNNQKGAQFIRNIVTKTVEKEKAQTILEEI